MIDARTIELINAEIDGVLNDSDAEELKARLAQSEPARRYHSELNRLAEFLDETPGQEMPAGLHKSIVDAIKLPRRRSLASRFNFGELPAFMRYGLPTTAVLLLTLSIYTIRENLNVPEDFSGMAGTMASTEADSQHQVLDTFSFENEGVSAKVSLRESDGVLVLDVHMNSDQVLEFNAEFTGNGLGFDEIAQMQSSLDSVQVADDTVRVKGVGQQQFAVLLHRREEPTAGSGMSIALDFSSGGTTIRQGMIEPGK